MFVWNTFKVSLKGLKCVVLRISKVCLQHLLNKVTLYQKSKKKKKIMWKGHIKCPKWKDVMQDWCTHTLKINQKTRIDVLLCFCLSLVTAENYWDVRYSSLFTYFDSSMWVLQLIIDVLAIIYHWRNKMMQLDYLYYRIACIYWKFSSNLKLSFG